MAVDWYCEIAGREVGPLSPQQLKAMAEGGRILPSDRVRRGLEGEWILVRQIKGLLPTTDSAAAGATVSAVPEDERPRPDPRPPPAPPPPPPPVVRPMAAEVPDVASIRIVTDPSDALLPRLKRQREQQLKMVGILLAAIVMFSVAGIFMAIGGSGEKTDRTGHGLSGLAERAARNARRKSKPDKTLVQTPEALVELEGIASLDRPSPKKQKSIAEILGVETDKPTGRLEEKVVEERAEKAVEKPPLDHKWVDASTAAAVVGNVSVRIVSAVVVPPRNEAPASGGQMLITVELINAGARDVDFKGWTRGGVARGVKLTDDAGKAYRAKAVGRAALPGRGPPMSIAAGRSGREVLAFEPPADEAEYVLIELPAAAFGMEGVVRMKVPATIITDQPPQEQEQEKPRRPRPGTPEYDFGLPEVDESIQ